MSFRFTGKWRIEAERIAEFYGKIARPLPKDSPLRESLFRSFLHDLWQLETHMSIARGEREHTPITVLPRHEALGFSSG